MAKVKVKAKIKERPIGVTILSVLGYIGSAATLLVGILAIVMGPAMLAFMSQFKATMIPMQGFFATAITLLGILLIGLAVLDFFIARGLWNGKNWARIIVLVLTSISAIGSLLSFELISLVINAVIIWYLGFYEEAKNYFK